MHTNVPFATTMESSMSRRITENLDFLQHWTGVFAPEVAYDESMKFVMNPVGDTEIPRWPKDSTPIIGSRSLMSKNVKRGDKN